MAAPVPRSDIHICAPVEATGIALSFDKWGETMTAVITLGPGMRIHLASAADAARLEHAASGALAVLAYHESAAHLPPLRATSHQLPPCGEQDHGWICTAQEHHFGDHTVYGPDGRVLHTWESSRPVVTA